MKQKDSAIENHSPAIKSIKQFVTDNPAFTEGGIRHALFWRGPALKEAGAVVQFGRRKLINEPRYLELLQDGFFSEIAGGAKNEK